MSSGNGKPWDGFVEHVRQRHERLPTQQKKIIKFGGGTVAILLVLYFVMPDSTRAPRARDPQVGNVFSGNDTRTMGVDALITEVQNTRDELGKNTRLVDTMRGELTKAKREVEEARQIQAAAASSIKKTEELQDRIDSLKASEQDRQDAYEADIARVKSEAENTVNATVKEIKAKEAEIEKRVNEVEALAKQEQKQQLEAQEKALEAQSIQLETLERKLEKIGAGGNVTIVQQDPNASGTRGDAKSIDTGTSFTPPDLKDPDSATNKNVESDPALMGPVEVKDGIATHPGFIDRSKPIPEFGDGSERRSGQRVTDPGDNPDFAALNEDPKMRAFLEAVRVQREETMERQGAELAGRRPPGGTPIDTAGTATGTSLITPSTSTQFGPGNAARQQGFGQATPQSAPSRGATSAPTQLVQRVPRGSIKTYGAGGEIDGSFDALAAVEESQIVSTAEVVEEVEEEEKPVEIEKAHLPSGTILSGVLITGMDAFTDLGSSRDPQPTLIRVTSKGILPNFFSNDYRECFLLAEGHGQLSSERVAIRVHTMSCVRSNGESFEVGLNAFASGEDGKEGVRGRVVSRNGQLLARSLQAGFMQGVSEAFGGVPVGSVNTSTDSGDARVVESLLNRDNLTNAGLSGTGKALERIAEYYLTMAEDIFPVIEIDAGREIDFIITKGTSLPVLDAEGV